MNSFQWTKNCCTICVLFAGLRALAFGLCSLKSRATPKAKWPRPLKWRNSVVLTGLLEMISVIICSVLFLFRSCDDVTDGDSFNWLMCHLVSQLTRCNALVLWWHTVALLGITAPNGNQTVIEVVLIKCSINNDCEQYLSCPTLYFWLSLYSCLDTTTN